jgi:hypothetical protein
VNRLLPVLLAVVGGAIAALVMVMLGTSVIFGLLWLYVFGDNRWPSWVDNLLDIAVPVAGFCLWGLFGWQIWQRVRRGV